MYGVHQLLWDIRRRPEVHAAYKQDPERVLDAYEIHDEFRAHLRTLDFKAMYEAGVNPYLLYFCAIQLEVDRAEYYAQLRGEVVR
jgi:aromatic-ring opening dioxygenase LigAB LigA subunit